MVGFDPNEKQKEEFAAIFEKKSLMTYREFLDLFQLKTNDYSKVDVKNSFRLLSKEYTRDGQITLERVQEILSDIGVSEAEIEQLSTQLLPYVKDDGYFNFEEFVNAAF